VRLLGFQPDVLSIVRAGNVFVLPSAAEPFGLALVEAMALGRPVIATRAGGPIEIVVEDESGLLVPPGDAAALGSVLIRLLREPGLAAKLSSGARARFEAHFTAPKMAAAMEEVYRASVAAL
jgi:glycosyltransferase involved in cell wall biosynthesis